MLSTFTINTDTPLTYSVADPRGGSLGQLLPQTSVAPR